MSDALEIPIFKTQASKMVRDEDYLTVLTQLILSARKSIELVQFVVDIRPQYDSFGLIRRLCHSLCRQASAGVETKVILADFTTIEAGRVNVNSAAERFLNKRGVETIIYSPASGIKSIHAKFLIVDGLISMVGSHNMSMGAMSVNHERSLLVESKEFSDSLLKSFSYYWQRGQETDQ